jgi:hypothetical protein
MVFSSYAFAYTNYSPGDLSSVDQAMVDEMLKVAAIGTSYRAFQPASNLGVTLGLDIGIDLAAVVLPADFKAALAQATQQPASQVPTAIPVPRFNLHKGFPFKVDLGFSYATYQNIFTVWGIDGQWRFLGSGANAISARMSYSHSVLYFIQTHNLSLDVVASRDLFIIEPYLGTGMQFWGGLLNVPAGGATGLPQSVSASQNGTTGHIFGGIPLKLLVLHLTGEIDYSFSGITTYGGKISLSF